jgi:hypothetical protein
MAQPPLLIIYQRALRATAFWLMHQPQVAGWLWSNPQAGTEPTERRAVALGSSPLPLFLQKLFFSLYVSGAFLRQPQDCNKWQLQFWFALFFSACYGVV